MQKEVIIALDIGSTKVMALVAEKSKINGEMDILGMGQTPSNGMKKGTVQNIDEAAQVIRKALLEAMEMGHVHLKKVRLSLAASHVESFNSMGVLILNNREVRKKDIRDILKVASGIASKEGREILGILPQEYKIDDIGGIKNPLGMKGYRLEVTVHVITVNKVLTKNLIKAVEQADFEVESMILAPVASSLSVLTQDDRKGPTLLVDIGGGTTDLAFWQQGVLVDTCIIPIGGLNFTHDLSVACRLTRLEAERLKIQWGRDDEHQAEDWIVGNYLGGDKKVSLKVVDSVLKARLYELFELIDLYYRTKWPYRPFPKKIVFTGGGSLLRGLTSMAEEYFAAPAFLAAPSKFAHVTNVLGNPKYATAIGVLMADAELNTIEQFSHRSDSREKINPIKLWKESMRKIFNLRMN